MNKVWLNGMIIDTEDARIDPGDRGFTLGDGIFETLPVIMGKPVFLRRHLERLDDGASRLGIEIDSATLSEPVRQTLRANRVIDGILRITVTRGPAMRGILPPRVSTPTVMIAAFPAAPQASAAQLVISNHTRRNEYSPLSRIKSLNYLDNVLARMEAVEAEANDAILLNCAGYIAEATTANIVLKLNNGWFTPRIVDGALPGVARAILLEHKMISESRLDLHDLGSAQAAMLVNSLGARAVSMIDDRLIEIETNDLEIANQFILDVNG